MNRSYGKHYIGIIVILSLTCQITDGLRILGIFPVPVKSHFVMSESLMRALAERGHQVDVYSHFPLKESVPNYNDYSLEGSMSILSNNVSFEYFTAITSGLSMSKLLIHGGKPACEILGLPIFQKLINEPPINPRYDVVITELFLSNCYLAWNRHLNIPLVGIVTTGLFEWLHDPLGNPQNYAIDTGVFSGFIAPMTFYERIINTLLSIYIKFNYNYYARRQDAFVEKYFGTGYPNVVEMQKDIDLLLVNSHHSLNGIKTYTPAVVPVGGLHIVDTNEQLPQDVQTFLDESENGFIYVSFGSMVRIETFPKHVLDVFYGAFKKISPIRVLMKVAEANDLPPGLPSNVVTQSWLPQITVLKHKNIKAFVTHGGLMGTQESIYYGVPMIGIPLYGDQYMNIESSVRKNIAVKLDLEKISEQSLTDAVEMIIKNSTYKESVDKVSQAFRDSPLNPRDTAVFWVEYIARHGKKALRSPLVDTPWWQASLLDVYGFMILIVLLLFYVGEKIIKFFYKWISSKEEVDYSPKLKKNV